MSRPKCEACGLISETLTTAHTTNGSVRLCGQCLAEINAKNPDVKLLQARVAELEQQRDKLQAFKDWVHQFLDTKGVPHHPPGVHGAEGCRIGDRMDYVWAVLVGDEKSRENLLRQQAVMQREVLELSDDLVPKLQSRVAELEAALRPFADYVIILDENNHADFMAIGYYQSPKLTVGDCRRAAAVLKGE